jgi:hypothetical protein
MVTLLFQVGDGALIATRGSDLWDGSIANPINVSEIGGLSSATDATLQLQTTAEEQKQESLS